MIGDKGSAENTYLKVATIQTKEYCDRPILIEIGVRKASLSTAIFVRFNGEYGDRGEPTLKSIYVTGYPYDVRIHHSAEWMWDVYMLKKGMNYCDFEPIRLAWDKGTCDVKWASGDGVAAIPEEATKATLYTPEQAAADAAENMAGA